MNVVVVSFFRNAAGGQVRRFMQQVSWLADAMPNDRVRVAAVEGDSTDDTRGELSAYATKHQLPLQLISRSHGGRVFGSTEEADRLAALSYVGNGGLEAVHELDQVVVYVESDLIWEAASIVQLKETLLGSDAGIVAPMVWAGKHFYDVFCYRSLDGQRFSPFPPYSHAFVQDRPFEVSSVGSCLVMHAEVARTVRIPGSEVLIGFCRMAREVGYHIYVDPTVSIHHP